MKEANQSLPNPRTLKKSLWNDGFESAHKPNERYLNDFMKNDFQNYILIDFLN